MTSLEDEHIFIKVIVDLNKIPLRERKKIVSLLKPLIISQKKNLLFIRYIGDREWREENRKVLENLHKLYHSLKEKAGGFMRCGCKVKDSAELTIVRKGNLYHIRSFPGQLHKHSKDCPLYDEPINTEEIWEKAKSDKKTIRSIFDFPKKKDATKKEQEDLFKPFTKSSRITKRNITFTRFMRSIIDDAYGNAFNSINKEVDRLKEQDKLKLPSNRNVIEKLNNKLQRLLSEFPNFDYFINILTKDDLRFEDGYLIVRHNRGKVRLSENQIFGWDLEEKGFSSSLGFYLNINIVKIKKDGKREVTRAFFLPILSNKLDEPFIPIESKNEANIIKKLLSENKKFFKVITGTLSKNYAKLGFKDKKCITRLLKNLTYYPDLILFEDKKVKVVEIRGLDNEIYKNLKKRVKRDFEILKTPDCPIEYVEF